MGTSLIRAASVRISYSKEQAARATVSPHAEIFFFHLAGDVPARDLLGDECANDKEAEDHGSFIAHRIATEKPDMVREGNYISVTNERGDEIFQVPLASTTA